MSTSKIISRDEAIAIANERYQDWEKIGDLSEVWEGGKDTEYYQKYRSLPVERLDGSDTYGDSKWSAPKTEKKLVMENGRFWYVRKSTKL